MADTTKAVGDIAERIARVYLEQKGYSILETNWRYSRLEVDIIAATPVAIVFVEVKYRHTDAFGEPEVFVGPRKQALIIRAAHEYLQSRDIDLEARFDVVAITGDANQPVIRHLEGAFYPVAK